MKNLQCPYCGEKLSYITALLEKSEGEHTCKKCGRNSSIYFVKAMRAAILATILIAAGVLTAWFFIGDKQPLWGMLWVLLPFVIFYLSIPAFFRLVPLKMRAASLGKEEKKKEARYFSPSPASGSTRVIPKMSNVNSAFIFMNDEEINDTSTKVIPTLREHTEDEYFDISTFANKK